MIHSRNKNYLSIASAIKLMLLVFIFSACSDKDGLNTDSSSSTGEKLESCILVYSNPEDEAMKKKVANYALEEFNKAQEELKYKVNFSFRFVSTEENLFDAAASDYLLNGKYNMVVGPDDNDSQKAKSLMNTATNCFGSTEKGPGIILPTITSTDISRDAMKLPFMRILCSDGRGQLHSALRAIYNINSPYVFLLYTDDDYGRTYSKFFETYASEAGFRWVGNRTANGSVNGLICVEPNISREDFIRSVKNEYNQFTENLENKANSYLFFNIIVASSNPEHGIIIDSLKNAMLDSSKADQTNLILFNRQNALKNVDRYHSAMFYSFSALPTNIDFAEDFKQRFGRYPINGESYFYDSILMALYAEYIRVIQNSTLDEGESPVSGSSVLNIINKGTEEVNASWNSDGIGKALNGLMSKKNVKLRGASSNWTFGEDGNINCADSTYFSLHIISEDIQNDPYLPILWFSSEIFDPNWYLNSGVPDDKWICYNLEMPESETGFRRELPDLEDRWALLVAGTQGTEKGKWGVNYRHQADVWNMYYALRNHGYAENHIIVVTEDDIFGKQLYGEGENEKVVKRSKDANAANLYEDISAHYKLSEITQQDIIDILSGKKSDRLPYVIEATEADNILLYWSGHGKTNGYLRWDGKNSDNVNEKGYFTPFQMCEAFNNLTGTELDLADVQPAKYDFRRFMMIIESCYSGKFITQMPQLQGVLYLAASEDEESSWADNDNLIIISGYGAINRFDVFSENLVNVIETDPDISLNHLYNRIYNLTGNSHPVIFNNSNYGNLSNLYFNEFRTR